MKNIVLMLGLLAGALGTARAQETRFGGKAGAVLFGPTERATRAPRPAPARLPQPTACGDAGRGVDAFAALNAGLAARAFVRDLLVFRPAPWLLDEGAADEQPGRRGSTARAVRFGVKAGVNVSDVAGAGADKAFKSIAGLNAGLVADIALNDRFSFHPELLFSQKGAKYDLVDPSGASFSGQGRTSYLDLPLLLRLRVNGLFFEAGPQWGYLLAQKSESTEYVPGLGTYSTSSTDLEGTRRLDFGYVAGVGYQLPRGLEVGVRYNGGIADLADPSDGPKVRNSVFQFQVGYLFGGK